jgi:hypothetical protein
LGRLKFDIRRERTLELRQKQLDQAFSLLGVGPGKEAVVQSGDATRARLLAELLNLRAWSILQPTRKVGAAPVEDCSPQLAEAALRDALAAVTLAPSWPYGHRMVAEAMELAGRPTSQVAAVLKKAMSMGAGLQQEACLEQLERLERGHGRSQANSIEVHGRGTPLGPGTVALVNREKGRLASVPWAFGCCNRRDTALDEDGEDGPESGNDEELVSTWRTR